MLIPVVVGFCNKMKIQPSKLLIPLSYASIFGGTCTLMGTSTNLVVYVYNSHALLLVLSCVCCHFSCCFPTPSFNASCLIIHCNCERYYYPIIILSNNVSESHLSPCDCDDTASHTHTHTRTFTRTHTCTATVLHEQKIPTLLCRCLRSVCRSFFHLA